MNAVESYLSVIGSAFLGSGMAFAAEAVATGGFPTTTASLKALLVGFVAAGLSGVKHLNQTSPSDAAKAQVRS